VQAEEKEKMAILNIIDELIRLKGDVVLMVPENIEKSLVSKIDGATLKAVHAWYFIDAEKEKQANNMLTACENILEAFINEVDVQSGKKITTENATILIEKAEDIKAKIEEAKLTITDD
jgi:hypothetical protein